MVGLLAAVAILMIFSTVVFQEWSELMRREREEEMIFRAKELVRGIYRYRLDHAGAGPVKLEQLMEPGPRGQYYLRRLYEDPLVADGKWGLLYQGPGGTIIDPSAGDPLAGVDPSAVGQLALAPNAGEGLALVGEGGEVGGLPIAGVKSLCKDKPFRIYNGFADYSEWLFTFLDLETGLASATGQPGGAPPVPSASQEHGFGGDGRGTFGEGPTGGRRGRNPGADGGGKKTGRR
jgi:hypothetical protein